jgi:hypothetical protein
MSEINWTNNTEIRQVVTLSIEIKDVVVGIYKYQGLRTILVPVLTLP